MQPQPDPPPPDPADLLPRDIYLQVARLLRAVLPPPVIDTPEEWALRDRAALARVAEMAPANLVEADLAIHHVAAMAHAGECLSQAAHRIADPIAAPRLRAQYASMGREARGFAGTLRRMQADRGKRAANDTEDASHARTERRMLGLMTEAMDSLPARPEVRQMEAPAPAAAARDARPMAPPPIDYDDWSDEEKRQDRLSAEASRYAILNPVRVKQIRPHGGMPPGADFEPPRDELLHEIVHGTHGNLTWAETYKPWVPPD